MAVSRMLHVSPSLIHVVTQSFLTLSFLNSDGAGGRTLPNPVGVPSNTIEACTSACHNAGYSLAGTEYAGECWCGSSIQAGGAPAPASECNMPCSGDNSQYCGGPNRLNLYQDTDATPSQPPVIVPNVGLWKSLGCYMSVIFHPRHQPVPLTLTLLISDNVGGRTLPIPVGVSSNTIESCTAACSDAGYDLAGTEYSAECWCGSSIEAGGAPAPATECNMVCSGNNAQYCGGPNRLNLYTITDAPSAGWESLGCYTSVFFHPRLCPIPSTLYFLISDNTNGRALPNQVGVTSNSMESCTSACYDAGYGLAGTEYSAECWCGSSIQGGGAPAASSDCNMPCTGDNTQTCGGPNRLNVYNYTGTLPTPPLPPGTPRPITDLPGTWSYDGCWM